MSNCFGSSRRWYKLLNVRITLIEVRPLATVTCSGWYSNNSSFRSSPCRFSLGKRLAGVLKIYIYMYILLYTDGICLGPSECLKWRFGYNPWWFQRRRKGKTAGPVDELVLSLRPGDLQRWWSRRKARRGVGRSVGRQWLLTWHYIRGKTIFLSYPKTSFLPSSAKEENIFLESAVN